MKTLDNYTNVKAAVSASSYAAGLITTIPVDATGFNRARFVFVFGPGGLTGSLSTGTMIYCGSTSGSITVSMPTAVLTAVTSGLMSGANYMAYIDTKITDGKPWLQVSAMSILSTSVSASCVVTLYDGTRKYPPTQSASQTVVV